MPTLPEQIQTLQQEIVALQEASSQAKIDITAKEQAIKSLYAGALASESVYTGVTCSVMVEAATGIPHLLPDTSHDIDSGDGVVSLANCWTKAGNTIPNTGVLYTVVLPAGATIGEAIPVDGTYHLVAKRAGQQIRIDVDKSFYEGDHSPDFSSLELLGKIIGQFKSDSQCVIDITTSAYNTWHTSLIEDIAIKTALANDGQTCMDQISHVDEP